MISSKNKIPYAQQKSSSRQRERALSETPKISSTKTLISRRCLLIFKLSLLQNTRTYDCLINFTLLKIKYISIYDKTTSVLFKAVSYLIFEYENTNSYQK